MMVGVFIWFLVVWKELIDGKFLVFGDEIIVLLC